MEPAGLGFRDSPASGSLRFLKFKDLKASSFQDLRPEAFLKRTSDCVNLTQNTHP